MSFRFMLICILTLIATTLIGDQVAAQTPTKPNVVVVFIDDMGWSDLSCFGGTGPKTQHIDRLAAEGVRFTNFYVNSPICSPSRVALTTGQYPQRWRITSFLNNRQSNEQREMAQWLDPQAPVLARQLQAAGYATGHFGKWHMGGQRNVDDAPFISSYGFDQSLTNFEGMGPKLLPLAMTPEWEKPRKIWGDAIRLGGPPVWKLRSHVTEGFVQTAISFIDEAQRRQEPFYVNVWPDDVHTPLYPPLDRWADDKRGLYEGVLDSMDEQLGPLFKRIRGDKALRDSTLIVFCSDNGPEDGAGTSQPLRGSKGWLYEGGVRSPLIVWGPGLLADGSAGTTNGEAVLSSIDINRSLYEICGVALPEGAELDGEDVSETLLANSTEGRQAPIVWRRPPDRPGFDQAGKQDNPDLAVRDGKWKYYVNCDGSDRQLYDLKVDASETTNIVSGYPDVAGRLHELAMEWNSNMPADAGVPEPQAAANQD
ncbi:sulfatase-like hydrolase/transferase [Aeoliella sp. ICT_H6.2]|uniref:Sulfatase-like hydrolase/transferase n=1 Tax=Aeoliella straminimaris TaxID=2954799 RepID=A0A9X2FAU4_9BACT|nr:sulfatase-like hydrolase/transferase [Aeoliella straminimaris]MCO6044823.1 sulfatase-like hydrolase/transferase [Aeoliella straminimaris]